ncbi:E3 ubiquitin-protein ligase TM129 [Eumeta japonica]|uniref:E3 ubiquitin-protein ligase TM129 n=1 Tax=Eumeta variegata TaxID=151549 RepID=A0A4C1Z413_EUMVA|nr:E3 ubiquitin-protein ligase TM129 [Eumeta japonica]
MELYNKNHLDSGISVDKIAIPLTATSKLIATESWIIKVGTYSVNLVRQDDAALIVTSTDIHDMTITGESEVQYVRIDVIPGRNDVKKFSFRITTVALRELQPRLLRQIVVPEHITLQPTLIERFANVFRQNIDLNSVYYVDQVQELCIGCMVTRADVKLQRSCVINPDAPEQSCQQCNCRFNVGKRQIKSPAFPELVKFVPGPDALMVLRVHGALVGIAGECGGYAPRPVAGGTLPLSGLSCSILPT